jgi:YfiH family protein
VSRSELSASLPGGGHVHFTDRDEGSMSSEGGEGRELAVNARRRLRDRVGVSSLARVHQVHGTVIRLALDGSSEQLGQEQLPHADGQITSTTGLGVMVLTADCLPVAIGREGAVGMVHAGWRGLAAGVLEQAVAALSDPDESELVAVIGPGAGACCYEVGPEVHAAFGDEGRGVANIGLRAIARERLLSVGVDRVEDRGGCTICDERYFSHRREGDRAGRMAGVAWLR